MLVWLVNWFAPMLRQVELHTAGDSRVFLTARTALASVTAFVLAIALGPLAIRWLFPGIITWSALSPPAWAGP